MTKIFDLGDELRVHRLFAAPSRESISQLFDKQCLFKVIKAVVFDHGESTARMTRYRYAPGDLILARRNTEEWVHWISHSEMLMLELPDSVLQDVADASDTVRVEIAGTPYLKDRRIDSLIQAVEAEQTSGFPSGRLFLDGIGRALAAAVMQARGTLRRPLGQRSARLSALQVRRVTERIQEQIGEHLSVAVLAETAGLSVAYFSEAFRKSTGYPPHQFVLRARLERAKEFLRSTDKTITEVAMACGFQSSQQFAKVFQRLMKTTPTQYRRTYAR